MKRINRTQRHVTFTILMLLVWKVNAQKSDTTNDEQFSFHFQTTVINQYKPSFYAKYSGDNSLSNSEEDQTTITSTLFAGARLWKGASFFFNPELSGGAGLSNALGVAASTNGESYRVGNPKPHITAARYFYRQMFYKKNSETEYQSSNANSLAGNSPTEYFDIIIGKVSVPDYFDDNKFSHDPRTQFMSWGLMSNGAWDVPSNVYGYCPSIVMDKVNEKYELHYAFSLIPIQINGPVIDWHVAKANSQTLEYARKYKFKSQPGAFRLMSFFTTTHMGNYQEALQAMALQGNDNPPDIALNREYGRTKYGFGANMEQNISNSLGCFVRASWNDGHNEDWMYSEIDLTLSAGLAENMGNAGRKDDNAGVAFVVSGISKTHREYLEAGGNGFLLGDGKLNYMPEQLAEIYYSASLIKGKMYVSGFYQFILNPGYNMDRGPVNVFSVRVHTEL